VSSLNTQPSLKGETSAAGIGKPFAFHPFSLRSSSYQQQEGAFEEMSEIKQLGLTPYLVKADVGDMGTLWRIYIGFYSTEEEAKKIKAIYKLANASIQKTEYACQVGEFSNETEILNMFERMRKSGYFPYAIQKDRNRFRLYLGAYERKAEAEVLRQDLQKKGISSQVVKR
jgi:cell division septation protein DedD